MMSQWRAMKRMTSEHQFQASSSPWVCSNTIKFDKGASFKVFSCRWTCKFFMDIQILPHFLGWPNLSYWKRRTIYQVCFNDWYNFQSLKHPLPPLFLHHTGTQCVSHHVQPLRVSQFINLLCMNEFRRSPSPSVDNKHVEGHHHPAIISPNALILPETSTV